MTTPDDKPGAVSRLAFHLSRVVIDVGVLIALGSMSLPFITAASGDHSAIDADALPALLLLIPVFLITLIPDHVRPVPKPLGWLALVLGATAFPYAVVKRLDAKLLADTLKGEVAIGATLLIVGTLVVLVGIVYGLIRAAFGKQSAGAPTRTARVPKGRVAPTATHAPTGRAAKDATAGPATRVESVVNDPDQPQITPIEGVRTGSTTPSAVSGTAAELAPVEPIQPDVAVDPPEVSPATNAESEATPPAGSAKGPAATSPDTTSGRSEPSAPGPGMDASTVSIDAETAGDPEPTGTETTPSSEPAADAEPRPGIAAPRTRRPVLGTPERRSTSVPPEGEADASIAKSSPDPIPAQTEFPIAAAPKTRPKPDPDDEDPELVQIELELSDIPDIEVTDEIDSIKPDSTKPDSTKPDQD